MTFPLMADASNPPDQLPAGAQAVAGYIGGNTPHVWTRQEWARFGHVKKHPMYVGAGQPDTWDAGHMDGLAALGMLFYLRVPLGIPLSLDMEEDISPAYVAAFGSVLKWANFYPWVYGSAGFVFRNPPLDGYHVADYPAGAQPFLYDHPKVRVTQYAPNVNGWDLNEVKPWQYHVRMRTW